MEIQASLLVAQLKAQRNALADEAALAVAQCHHLMEECAKLKELSDKQQGLLAEADKLMRAMSKESETQPRVSKSRVRRTKAQMAALNGKSNLTTLDAKSHNATQEELLSRLQPDDAPSQD